MADERRLVLNGVDLSAYVKRVDPTAIERAESDQSDVLQGVRPTGPITIEGWFTDYICGSCRQGFNGGEEGVPVVTNLDTGDRFPVCPACFVALHT